MSFRLPPIEVSDDNPFEHDALERNDIVEFVANVVAQSGGQPFVLAIDSPYGTGKSTFVEMLGKVLTARKFQTVYFDAWKADHVTDPLIAMVAALDEAMPKLSESIGPVNGSMKRVKKVAGILLKRGAAVGVKLATAGVVDLSEDIEEALSEAASDSTTDIIESFEKETEATKCFKGELEKAIASLPQLSKKPTLVFFIDELDRCRPDFAMSLMERIKHIFDVPNIAFVLSVDKLQLEAVTAAVYGERINAAEYLRKFIDLEFGLPSPSKKAFISKTLTRAGMDARLSVNSRGDRGQIVRFLSLFADIYELSLRAIERCIVRLKLVLSVTPETHGINAVHVSLLVVLRSADRKMFDDLVSGNINPLAAMSYFRSKPQGSQLLSSREGMILESMLITELYDQHEKNEYRKELTDRLNHDSTPQAEMNEIQDRLQILDAFAREVVGRGRLARIAASVDIAANIRD